LPENDATLFSYAMYLLAKWREPRGYPLIVRWLSLPGRGAFAIGGDTVTQEGSRFLASTCGGDLEPINQRGRQRGRCQVEQVAGPAPTPPSILMA
jgi:hypothetical protein